MTLTLSMAPGVAALRAEAVAYLPTAYQRVSIRRALTSVPFALPMWCNEAITLWHLVGNRSRLDVAVPPLRLMKSPNGSFRSLYSAAYCNSRDHLLRAR